MVSPKHSSRHGGAAVVAPPAATHDCRLPPWDGQPFYTALVGITVIFGIHACGNLDGYLALAYVNTMLLAVSARWFDHSAPGSAARRVSRLAVFLLVASLIAGVFICVLMAAPPVAAYFYVVFVLGEDA